MSFDTLHKRDFGGHVVWVTIGQPAVFDENTQRYIQKGFISAFRIGSEPLIIDGEYVKEENGKVKFFSDHNSALIAAFDAARKKIHNAAK